MRFIFSYSFEVLGFVIYLKGEFTGYDLGGEVRQAVLSDSKEILREIFRGYDLGCRCCLVKGITMVEVLNYSCFSDPSSHIQHLDTSYCTHVR